MIWGDFILGFIAGFVAYGLILLLGEVRHKYRERELAARYYWPQETKPDLEPDEINAEGIQRDLKLQKN